MGLRTYVRARTLDMQCNVYVQSIYFIGGGLIIEANIPVQVFEGQRGEGAYFRENTVLIHVSHCLYGVHALYSTSVHTKVM